LADEDLPSVVNAIKCLAPQLVSFAWGVRHRFTVDKMFNVWPFFTSLRVLTLPVTQGLLLILETLHTELHHLRLLPWVDGRTFPSITPILVATRAWSRSLSNLKMLTIPMVEPGSEEERGELLRICDAKGVEAEEFGGREVRRHVTYWEDLVLAWSVISVYLEYWPADDLRVQRFSRVKLVWDAWRAVVFGCLEW
jgi:hypothetical protein